MQFGELVPGVDPVERSGAYGVAVDGDKVLVVRWRGGLYLPGGGIDEGETPEAALRREVLEETGYEVLSAFPLGSAKQYTYDRARVRYTNKVCAFFRLTIGEVTAKPIDEEETALWLPAEETAATMYEEASGWAIREVFKGPLAR